MREIIHTTPEGKNKYRFRVILTSDSGDFKPQYRNCNVADYVNNEELKCLNEKELYNIFAQEKEILSTAAVQILRYNNKSFKLSHFVIDSQNTVLAHFDHILRFTDGQPVLELKNIGTNIKGSFNYLNSKIYNEAILPDIYSKIKCDFKVVVKADYNSLKEILVGFLTVVNKEKTYTGKPGTLFVNSNSIFKEDNIIKTMKNPDFNPPKIMPVNSSKNDGSSVVVNIIKHIKTKRRVLKENRKTMKRGAENKKDLYTSENELSTDRANNTDGKNGM